MTIQVVIEKGVITSVQTTGAEENATLPLPPLHNTVLGGHLEVCEFLLEKGAKLEATDNKVSFFSFFLLFSRLTHSVCRDGRHCTGQQSMVA